METLARLLRPVFLPLLRLELAPPHLPEGSSLVRALKPTEQWLAYRFLAVLFGLLNQLIGAAVGAIALVMSGGRWGLVLAVFIALVEVGVVGFALVATRVDYELRHYLVGDRSLRVAQGAWKREEVTLSYANIQNLEVTQGPLERLFGFKSLSISTAGSDGGPGDATSHVVSLVGLEDADELRGLMLNMLRRHHDSGLGDAPERVPAASALTTRRLVEIRDAARALSEAARASSSAR